MPKAILHKNWLTQESGPGQLDCIHISRALASGIGLGTRVFSVYIYQGFGWLNGCTHCISS